MKWKIPLADIDLDEAEWEQVQKVLRSKWLSMGAVTQKFERAFSRYVGSKHAFAVSNGTAALHLALMALGIGEGDEVIIPSLTFVATANSVLYMRARPVFADATSEDDFNISPESIRDKITKKTKAIIVVHYAGYPCNMSEILKISDVHNLKLVEDAAHAPGAEFNGEKCGTIGHVGCFSFFSNKNVATGEGGMVVTDDDELAERIRLFRSHGMTTLTWERYKGHAWSYDVVDLGYNYRIDELRSAIGIAQLQKLKSAIGRRRLLVMCYRQLLKDIKGISIPFSRSSGKSAYHLFPILLENETKRASVMEGLKKKGIQVSIHYPPVHLFSFYRKQFGYRENDLPLAESISQREVTLPLFSTMTMEDIRYISHQLERLV